MARFPRRGVIVLAALAALVACHHEPPAPKLNSTEQARKFLDVFPFPALSATANDEGARLAPLQDGYLLYISTKDFGGAAKEFDRVAKEHPDMVEARFLQGVSLVLADRPADAVPVLEGVVRESPSYSPGRWFLGQAYFATGKESEALEQMREVEKLSDLYSKEAAKVLAASGS